MDVTRPISLLTEESPPAKERVEKSSVLTVIIKDSSNEYITGGGVKLNTVPNPSYADVVKLRGGLPT